VQFAEGILVVLVYAGGVEGTDEVGGCGGYFAAEGFELARLFLLIRDSYRRGIKGRGHVQGEGALRLKVQMGFVMRTCSRRRCWCMGCDGARRRISYLESDEFIGIHCNNCWIRIVSVSQSIVACRCCFLSLLVFQR
jgi:hypothetical protein